MNIQRPALPVLEHMENKKKILHIIQSLDNGGCENMLLRTLPLLDSFDHSVVTLRSPGTLASEFQKNNISVENINLKSFFYVKGLNRLTQKVTRAKPDIIITYLLHADILGRLVLQVTSKAKVIPFLRTTYNHPRYRLARLFEYLTKRLVSHYFANSDAVKNFYIKKIGVKAEKIAVIPNGIDMEYFKNISPALELRSSLDISEDDTVIICVANLHGNKGHRYLLEAFEEIYKIYPKIQLLLVGDGEEKENILHQIKNFSSEKSIHLLGQRSDVPSLLSISDIFVLPTLFEGMSNALLEAMASHLPIISTDIPENRQIIITEKNGILIPPKESSTLSEALKTLLENPDLRETLSEAGFQTVSEKFSLKKTAFTLSKAIENSL